MPDKQDHTPAFWALVFVMFLGWEGVGLCSYLLIAFWYRKQSASQAGKKAFLVNRVGDFGFTLGMFLIFVTTGTLQYTGVFERADAGEIAAMVQQRVHQCAARVSRPRMHDETGGFVDHDQVRVFVQHDQ